MAGFSFGTGLGNTSGGGFKFSTPSTTTSAPTASSAPSGFSFSTAAAPSATGFAPTSSAVATSGTPSFSFSLNTANTAVATTTTTSSSTTPSLFNLSGSTGINLSTTPSLGTATTTSTFSFTTPSTSTFQNAASQPSILGPGATLSTSTTTTSFGASGAGGATNLSMRQLEERLNKWLVELKEQEERFIRQAAHVNAWDQILQNGHDQVQALKDTLHTVKSDQSRLEAEIDFIRGQQEELERLLEPLESATNANPATQLHQGDRQRDNMYYLAQSLDGQLRQMTDDLGKVIEHLNTNSGSWQPNDPVTQVARILSAHMDTLKWVDHNTTTLSQKMDEVSRVAANTNRRG